jgi:hypothetical protein
LCGQCPHNFRVKSIEAEIAIKLATVAVADIEFSKAFGKFG